MKVETKYICEICGAIYSDKSDCEECERSHVANLKIIHRKQYELYEGWPQYIDVRCEETGECATYEIRYSKVHD